MSSAYWKKLENSTKDDASLTKQIVNRKRRNFDPFGAPEFAAYGDEHAPYLRKNAFSQTNRRATPLGGTLTKLVVAILPTTKPW